MLSLEDSALSLHHAADSPSSFSPSLLTSISGRFCGGGFTNEWLLIKVTFTADGSWAEMVAFLP